MTWLNSNSREHCVEWYDFNLHICMNKVKLNNPKGPTMTTTDTTKTELTNLAAKFKDIKLKHGGHPSPEAGLCLMEAVALMAGESHGDTPACACPVLSTAGQGLNDCSYWENDQHRTDVLLPYASRIIGTAQDSTDEVRIRRAEVAAEIAEEHKVDPSQTPAKRLEQGAKWLMDALLYVTKANAEEPLDQAMNNIRKARETAQVQASVGA